MSLTLVKKSGYESDKAKNKIAYNIGRKLDSGAVKLGDLTNAEMYIWDKAKSKYYGKMGNKKEGRKAASFANWAKTNRAEPGKNTVGTGGNRGKGKSFSDHKKNPQANPVNKPRKPRNIPTGKSNTKVSSGRGKAGLILGGAGLGLMGLTEYMDHKNDK